MGARLRVFLTREQDQKLLKLRTENVPQKVKDRAEVIRLNVHGWYVERIARGLYIFFFPKYCSEMNPIELEWQHLKKGRCIM